jgi:hypothetical protein
MKQSRKDFIKKAHENACSDWKKNIEREFPKLFKKDDLEVGKWYNWNGINPAMGLLSKKPSKHSGCYQFDYLINGETKSYDSLSITYLSLATDKEVEQALIKEAKKKGLKTLNHRCLLDNLIWKNISGDEYRYYPSKNKLMIGASTVFLDGVWAKTIKETITKEQAEKELGKIIEG